MTRIDASSSHRGAPAQPISPAPELSSMIHALQHWAQQRPQALAFRHLLDGEQREAVLSFYELERRARAVALALRAQAAPGDRALLLYPQGLDFIVAFLGCLYAGVIAVPAYPPHRGRLEHTLPRLLAIAKDSGASLLLTTAALDAAVGFALPHCPELSAARRLATDTLPDPGNVGSDVSRLDSSGLAFLQYTSGSTGAPKGVMITHANLVHNAQQICRAFEHDDTLVGVGWLPLYHDMGLIGKVLQPLYLGRPCTLMAPLDFIKKPVRWLQAISRYGATTSGGPNFAYELCARKIDAEQKRGLDLSSWRVAFVGAEPVREGTLERFYQAFASCGFRREAFRPAYGLAENTLMVSGASKDHSLHVLRVAAAALSAGRAEPPRGESERCLELVASGAVSHGQEVRIVDPELGTPCADGRIGEIWVRGGSVARGYWNRPEETEAVFGARPAGELGEPFLRTGDLGLLQQGQLYVTGRIKDLLIIAGKNHYPQDIESCVERAAEGVRAGAVAAFAIDRGEREALAILAEVDARRVTEENSAQLAQLVEALRRAVALEHEVMPAAVWLVAPGTLPKTSSGKLQRHLCRIGFEAGTIDALLRWSDGAAADTASEAPRPENEVAAAPQLYPDIEEGRRKIDRRHTRYRFELERDVPWTRVSEPGQYFGTGYLEMIGVNEAALRRHPAAYEACQWALALSTCASFITVEEYLLFFTRREQARLGACRSLELFQEEEQKHIQLFGRYAAALRAQRPDLAARIQPHIERCNTAHQLATANASGMDDALFHYQFWLYALVLEEGSIHICDKLMPDAERIQPAWLATHVAHRREEIQHVATDAVHVKALGLSHGQREHLSQMWFRHLANNWGYMHGVQAAHALLAELYPEVAAEAFPSPLHMPPRFLSELLTHRAFSNTRAAAPYLAALAEGGVEAAQQELQQLCAQRAAPILPPAAGSLRPQANLSNLAAAVSPDERREVITQYLLERIGEAARVTPASLLPSQHLLDAGIDSVAGAELAGQIERDLGVDIPFATVFDSTIDGLIERVLRSSERAGAPAAHAAE